MALHLAAEEKRENSIRLLLTHGSDVNAKDDVSNYYDRNM